MGMPGMSTSEMVAYTQPKEAASVKQSNSKMTVAEYRNAINPVSKYYDNWSITSFIEDISIPAKTKIEVLCGKLIAGITNEETWKAVFNKVKGA